MCAHTSHMYSLHTHLLPEKPRQHTRFNIHVVFRHSHSFHRHQVSLPLSCTHTRTHTVTPFLPFTHTCSLHPYFLPFLCNTHFSHGYTQMQTPVTCLHVCTYLCVQPHMYQHTLLRGTNSVLWWSVTFTATAQLNCGSRGGRGDAFSSPVCVCAVV